MPPASKEGGWTEAKTVKFLTYVACSLGGSPAAHFATIAQKMGPDVTVGSLKNKWQRIKAEVEKEGGLTTTPAKAGGKQSGQPKKGAADASEDDEETPKAGKKRKGRGATPKSKKAKLDAEDEVGKTGETEEGEVKEEAGAEV